MRDIVLFVEDVAHYEIIRTLLERLAVLHGVRIRLDWRNTRRGHGAVIGELRQFLRDLQRSIRRLPDLLIVATDANCKGYAQRVKEIRTAADLPELSGLPIVCAVPDPHIERWLLVDSAAFKHVFGRGCDAPDLKCERDRYKQQLAQNIRRAGVAPSLGGVEFAADLMAALDLERAATLDPSLGRFLAETADIFARWRKTDGDSEPG